MLTINILGTDCLFAYCNLFPEYLKYVPVGNNN